jgi:hypothetical protein
VKLFFGGMGRAPGRQSGGSKVSSIMIRRDGPAGGPRRWASNWSSSSEDLMKFLTAYANSFMKKELMEIIRHERTVTGETKSDNADLDLCLVASSKHSNAFLGSSSSI